MLATFADAFLPGLAADAIAGALVLGFGYVAIDRRLRLEDKLQEAERERQRKLELRQSALRIVYGELESHASLFDVWETALGTADAVPFPGFDVNGWFLVSQADVLASLAPETASVLMHAYNRLRSANDQLAQIADMSHGPSAIRVAAGVSEAAAPDGTLPPMVARMRDAFAGHLEALRAAMLDRLADLRTFVYEAIDAIERELGEARTVPAAQRTYVREKQPKTLGS